MGIGRNLGDAMASVLTRKGAETTQRGAELALEALGHSAAPCRREAVLDGEGLIGPFFAAAPTARRRNARASTNIGGSGEVQRNILSRVARGV